MEVYRINNLTFHTAHIWYFVASSNWLYPSIKQRIWWYILLNQPLGKQGRKKQARMVNLLMPAGLHAWSGRIQVRHRPLKPGGERLWALISLYLGEMRRHWQDEENLVSSLNFFPCFIRILAKDCVCLCINVYMCVYVCILLPHLHEARFLRS